MNELYDALKYSLSNTISPNVNTHSGITTPLFQQQQKKKRLSGSNIFHKFELTR